MKVNHEFNDRYEILISNEYFFSKCLFQHFSGGNLSSKFKTTYCPNCNEPLFPIFNLDFSDIRLRKLDLWDSSYLHVLICLNCALYLEPYWIKFYDDKFDVIGGMRGNPVLNGVEYPFPEREIKLCELEMGRDSITLQPFKTHHQIGGCQPISYNETLSCVICANQMKYAGIVDNDDSNIYLYDSDHFPITLVIGDCDKLFIFTCKKCKVLGIKWIS